MTEDIGLLDRRDPETDTSPASSPAVQQPGPTWRQIDDVFGESFDGEPVKPWERTAPRPTGVIGTYS